MKLHKYYKYHYEIMTHKLDSTDHDDPIRWTKAIVLSNHDKNGVIYEFKCCNL